MGVKYRCNFNNFHNVNCSVEISSDLYDGEVIPVLAVQKEECTISPSGAEVPFDEPLRPTAVRINFHAQGIDIDELQRANDRDWKITVRHGGDIKFVGFMIPDGLQRTRKGAGNVVIINGTCGLSLTQGVSYATPPDLGLVYRWEEQGGIDFQVYGHARNIINILRACLAFNPLPFRWHCNVRWEGRDGDDLLSGEVPFAGGLALGELAALKDIDVHWIVENIVNSVKCFIVQDEGYWNIISWDSYYNNRGSYEIRQIAGGMGSKEVFVRNLGDITNDMSGKYINDTAYTMYSRSVGSVDVTYSQKQTANVVTNGSFDRVEGSRVLGWRWDRQTIPVSAGQSINGRPGRSALVQTVFNEDYITTDSAVNIDGHTLYKYMSLGFTFSPYSTGWPVNSEGEIQWGSRPFKISIEWTLNNGTPYYLNEFGFWQDSARGIPLGISYVRTDRDNVGTNQFRWGIVFEGSPNIGDVIVMSIPNRAGNGAGFTEYSFTVTELEEGNLQQALERAIEQLPNSMGSGSTQYNLSQKGVEMYSPTAGSIRFTTLVTVARPSGRTYKSSALQEYRFIYPNWQSMHVGDVVKFETSGIKIPDPGELTDSGTLGGKLRIRFYTSATRPYLLDDVYISLDDNSDLYTTVVNPDNSKLEYTLGISSAFSGFYISSFLQTPGDANVYMNYLDGTGSGTLTELYSRGVMQMRHDPKKLFSGDFMLPDGLSVLSSVRALGDDYIPMSYDWNLGTGQVVNFKGFESRIFNVAMETTHKGNNDDNLIN